MSYFKYIEEEKRYELVEGTPPGAGDPLDDRVFTQAAVLHTSEDAPIRLTRAYSLEDDIAFTDRQLKLGAAERGQKLGDISGGKHLPDAAPEEGY